MEEKNNISQELLETIERYLKNAMDVAERISFEQQLKEDAVLQQQVTDTKLILTGIKKAVLKKKLHTLHEELVKDEVIVNKKPKVFKLNFRTLSIAASVLILVGGFWFFNQQPSNKKLFDTYFEPDRGLATVMSKGNNHAFDDAMVDYKNEKYDLAIKKWEVLLKSKPENDTLNYFLGVAHLANDSENKAIKFLENTITLQKNEFTKEAYYYLGLAYLKADNTKAAIKNLKNNDSPKSDRIISELHN